MENGLWACLLGNYHVFGAGLRCHAEAMNLNDFMTGRVILSCLRCMGLGPQYAYLDDLTRVASTLRRNGRSIETPWMQACTAKTGLGGVGLPRLVEAIQSQYQMMPILAMMHGATTLTGLAYGKPAQEFWPLLAQVPALPRASTLQCHR